MSGEPNYYQLLGIEPTADQAAIDAAYQGRSLRFRLGQLRDRARAVPGPTQEEVEQAYAVLGNPESRALYDAAYFPEKAAARQGRRVPVWLLVASAVWIAIMLVVCVQGARSRLVDDGGAIGRFVSTSTVTAPASVAAAAVTETATAPPSVVPPTVAQASVLPSIAPTLTPTVAASAAPSSPGLTFRPTETAVPSPTSTSAPTSIPTPTVAATVAPAVATTAVPPTATAEPPTPTPAPPPEPTPTPEPPPPPPTPTPSFQATDRIGTVQPVNLRAGPGTNFAIVRALPQGTLLRATGESAYAGGLLWRRFLVAGGGNGWVRDIDVLPVR